MEYYNAPFELKSIQEEGEDKNFFFFEGLASTFGNIDLVGDRIEPGAFKKSLRKLAPKVLWQHDRRNPIGISVVHKETSEGLFVRAKLPRNDSLVKGRVIPQMQIGSINTLSIGFRTLKEDYDGKVNVIKEVQLLEYSPVTFEANPLAKITNMKAATSYLNLPLADRTMPWSKSTAIASIREHTNSTEKPSSSYKKYFMWYDKEDAENFGAYKLPYAQWLDGGFKAVPRALFAIRGAVNGARGGLNIPDADKTIVAAHVERYLSKLEDDKSVITLEDVIHIKTKPEFNEFLKSFDTFSRSSREYLTSLLSLNPSKSDEGDPQSNSEFEKMIQECTTILKNKANN